jgi:hypothetical protein
MTASVSDVASSSPPQQQTGSLREASGLPSSWNPSFVPAVARAERNVSTEYKPLCETAAYLVALNKECSRAYASEPNRSTRDRYKAVHPTEILIFKCMDGRLHLTMASHLPNGAVYPYRNVAGKFDLGWPALREEVTRTVNEATVRGRRVIALCSYHYSSGCKERGCRGMNYDTAAARRCAKKLASQFQEAFAGGSRAAVIPLIVGIETDDEALIFESFQESIAACKEPLLPSPTAGGASPHDRGGDDDGAGDKEDILTSNRSFAKKIFNRLDVRDFAAAEPNHDAIKTAIARLLPGIDQQLANDMMPIVLNNALHIYTRRQLAAPIVSLNHEESVIAVGVGFDWFHVPNKAFIIGPYDHEWPSAVAVAASVISGNVRNKVIDASKGIVLMASSYCSDMPGSWGWKMAEMTTRYYARVARAAIADEASLLAQTPVHVLMGVVEKTTLEFHVVEDGSGAQ